MAPWVTPTRRTRDDLSEDDESEDTETSHTSKRQRNVQNDSPSQSPVLPDEYLAQRTTTPSQSSQTPKHQPGAIVRVKLVNFVTYTNVEIFPGPSLNMVIGPNGTGKSTLVCAICLGLGWPPKHLGRQKEYSEFVKNGEKAATIEIELQRGPGRDRNPVVRCELKRDGNKVDFFINGNRAKQKQVQHLARRHEIQIDNLCQFLPQDKVVEFAAMSPIELLRSTQEAVGSKKMLAWHDELKQIRKDQKLKEIRRGEQEQTLKGLENRQRGQEADVARLREREQIKENVRLWTNVMPFAEYEEAQKRYREDSEQHQAAQVAFSQLKDELEPTLQAATDKGSYREKIEASLTSKRRHLDEEEKRVDSIDKKIQKIGEDVKLLDSQVQREHKDAKTIAMERKRLQNSINDTRRRMEEPAPEFDTAFHNDRINSHERNSQEKGREVNEIQLKMQQVHKDLDDRQQKVFRATSELKSLDTQVGQQESKLSRVSSDALKVWQWIKENPEEFRQPVFGPPMVECSITDPRYVSVIEALFSKSSFTAITAQTTVDFKKLQDVIYKQLKVSDVSVRQVSEGFERYRAPVSQDQMKEFGFDGWAIDYLKGPEPVLAMLCEDVKIHQSGVSLQDTTDQQYRQLENSNVGTWATNKNVYRIVRRREYGPGAVSTTVRDVRPGQVWTDQPVDPQAKVAIQQRIIQLKGEAAELKDEWAQLKSQRETINSEITELQSEIDNFKMEKEEAKKLLSQHRGLPAKLENFEEKLESAEQEFQKLRKKAKDVEAESTEKTLLKVETAADYSVEVEKLAKLHEDLLGVEIMLIEASSDHETLVAKNRSVQTQLELKQQEVQTLDRSQKESRKVARDLGRKCRKVMDKAEEDEDEALAEFIREHAKDVSCAKVESEIASEQARLDLMHGGDGRIIEEFEKRAKTIEEIQERMQVVEAEIKKFADDIAKIRQKWEPRLDNLIRRISDSFAFNMKQIYCAGEVSIDKDEDFDKWAISIKVKFREEEDLTQLDAHRQSGGERAVSTIFYLMSLQTLARSPFRVVDEINQGMDPRNERLVHSRMVAIATGNDEWFQHYQQNLATTNNDVEDGLRDTDDEAEPAPELGPSTGGSQYFLITPKLLHGLRYEPGMRVLVIGSGEFMPEAASHSVDLAKALQIRKGAQGISAAG